MYLGRIVEYGPAEAIFRAPSTPTPSRWSTRSRDIDPDATLAVRVLAGEPPSPLDRPAGCAFHPRCPHAMDICRREPGPPPFVRDGVRTWCHLYRDAGREQVAAMEVQALAD